MTLPEKDDFDMMYLLSSIWHLLSYREWEKIISLDIYKCFLSCQMENHCKVWQVWVSEERWSKWASGWRQSQKWVLL